MHRSTPWFLAIGVTVAVVAAACSSGSSSGKSTSLASAEPAGSVGASGAVSGSGAGAPGSAAASANVGADVFSCPSAAEINALTAMGFTAAVGNSADHCEYVVATGSTQAVRVTIDHPPATATSTHETLAQFRMAIVAAGNVVLTSATQYSTESFIARYGTLSCSVFALARDGQVMQVQASHQTPVPTDDCSLAQSVTAVAGTATVAAANSSGADSSGPESSGPESSAPDSGSPSSGDGADSSGISVPVPVPPAPVTSPTTPTPPPVAPTTVPTTKRPSTPTSRSEVLIFTTGPAAPFTLPKLRPTTTSR